MVKIELTQLVAPLEILKSLYDNRCLDDARKIIQGLLVVQHEKHTVLVSTDTHLMMVATSPEPLDIEASLYGYFQKPDRYSGAFPSTGLGQALLTPLEGVYPNWQRVVPDPATQEVMGEYQNLGSGSKRLAFNRLVTINAGYLSRLAKTDAPFTITGTKHTEKDYHLKPLRFEGTQDKWDLLYVFMPMQGFNIVEREAFRVLRKVGATGNSVVENAA